MRRRIFQEATDGRIQMSDSARTLAQARAAEEVLKIIDNRPLLPEEIRFVKIMLRALITAAGVTKQVVVLLSLMA